MTSVLHGRQLARLLGRWDAGRGIPDYVALATAVRGLLNDGRLALGLRLPAERELATALGISRTTVTAGYRLLRESGHVTSRRGAGSWTTMPGGARVGAAGIWSPSTTPDMIDLGRAALDAPPELTVAAAEALTDLPRYLGDAGYHPVGLIELRTAVADGYTRRGLPTSPEQIMITSGVQNALDLAVRLLVPVGQPVLVESPTYPNALVGFAARRSRMLTYGLDDAGWDGELLLDNLRQNRPRVAYLIPEFQNPTGHLMPQPLRERLPAAAHSAGTDLIIDESFVDLALDVEEMPLPVASFDRHARVLTIGGMSKTYWGGLRIGWVRAAAPVVQRLAAVRVGVDMSGPVLDQLVAARLLAHASSVVEARRVRLRRQRDVLMAALRERLPEWRFRVPAGGVTLWLELDAPISSPLCRAVERYGIRLAPGPRFGMDGTMERFLRMPFTLPERDLLEAVDRMVEARGDLDAPYPRGYDTPALVA
ncbi:MocR-like transcription factor YczR [Rugosimonospora africana]|uniref:GntR family transcriptional regulator n=1 Tax=Rugosimonospora africana TaxID=556532 RepID=A0A8J3R038_9ACTN|nr:PLP-dependent aminotransferase family protein [Rugosimonospora africana]GIH19088.1 GntR family transcriptional regulator [Rugosimonospora africana]